MTYMTDLDDDSLCCLAVEGSTFMGSHDRVRAVPPSDPVVCLYVCLSVRLCRCRCLLISFFVSSCLHVCLQPRCFSYRVICSLCT
jgi:hypothetical protein